MGVNLHLNPRCLPAHPSTPALYTLHSPLLTPSALRVRSPLPHPSTTPQSDCDAGIRLNSHRAAGDTWMLWNQLLLREKDGLCVFYDASSHSGVCSTCSALQVVPCVLWHGFTHSVQPGVAGGIWAADRGSGSCRRMWAESQTDEGK